MDEMTSRGQRVGLHRKDFTDEAAFIKEIVKREGEERDFFAGIQMCCVCGLESVPVTYGHGDEFIDICQHCGASESFLPLEVRND